MKQWILLLCGISPFVLTAQSPGQDHKFTAGLTVGVTQSYLAVTVTPPSSVEITNVPELGFRAAAHVSYQISRYVFLTAQPGYFRLRAKAQSVYTLGNGFMVEGQLDETYHWIELPVDINYIINPSSKVRVFVGAGVSVMHLVEATHAVNSTFNLAAVGRAGMEFSVGSRMMRLTISADKILQDIENVILTAPNSGFDTPQYAYRYNTLGATLTYIF